MAVKNKGFAAGAVVGLGVAAAAAAGMGVRWPAAMADSVNGPGAGVGAASRLELLKASTAPIFAPPPGAPMSFADIFDRVAPAVVSIDVTTHLKASEMQQLSPFSGLPFQFNFPQGRSPQGRRGGRGSGGDDDSEDGGTARKGPEVQASGSGFFIRADGYLVTNNHVVENADTIKITLNDKRQLTARVIGRDESTDLAVLKVDGGPFPFVNFENQAKARVGDWVLAIGNPLGLGGTATAGIVSTIGRALPDNSSAFYDYIQIDAPINRGNSGGPTFDVYGRVIGVNTAIYSQSGGSIGIGFDIPADVVDTITTQLISGGRITRGYLGVGVQEITSDIADSLGLKQNEGALVGEVTPGGPAEKAGLRQGDVILAVNGHAIASRAEVTRQVANVKAGEIIHLALLRDGRRITAEVRSGTRPSETALNATGTSGGDDENGDGAPTPGAPHVVRPVALGMTLGPLTDAARKRYSLDAKIHGVLIESVADDSDVGQKGVKAGDVVARAGDRTVATPADVSAAVADARKAGRKSILLLVWHDGRSVFLPVKLDSKADPKNG